MAKLNQIIAVEKGVKDEYNRTIDTGYKAFQKTDSHTGISRVYKPKDDGGEELPSEERRVQLYVDQTLQDVFKRWGRLCDVIATKDLTNTQAKADIKLEGGTVIATDVPVTTLLWLEKQLNDIATVLSKTPVLDISRQWTWDSTSGAWKSSAEETRRTKKVMRNHVVAEATDKHPAQVTVYTEDEPVGTWTTIHFSGALQTQDVHEMKERVTELQKSVKFAREEANSIDVIDLKIGDKLFEYILNG